MVYGQFNTDTVGLTEFYRHSGMDVSNPDAPLHMNALIDLPAVIAPLPAGRSHARALPPATDCRVLRHVQDQPVDLTGRALGGP
ncbi:hypothetical protein IFM12275_03440 [Nocardia sputorum]|uniref:Uncharacterized protein n=1 Tax=Nocardia sputorum TaxID=2984338 RepID=A0ABN6U1D0_9NOCA|nr:hypothetical protein IFM12275_03440 [Nocardia sputorum]BDT98987.1 hypothetical protein IFM12276_20160 [Nocardia sputorum]